LSETISSREPSIVLTSSISFPYSPPSAERMRSPWSRSTPSPHSALTTWSPPIPMWRWIRQIGRTISWRVKALNHAIAWW
jgi:hypothetical protein